MWVFLTSGLVMPCDVEPHDKADKHTLGYRDLQVRGRLIEHLDRFIKDYMDPYGLDHSAVIPTPSHDYTCRFYTTKDAFGEAMKHAVLDIDYRHFKDQSTRKDTKGRFVYQCAEKYHSLLLRIWAASLSLAPAGSFYGPWSRKNPDGYKPRKPLQASKDHKYSWDGDDTLWDSSDDDWWAKQATKDLEDEAREEDAYIPAYEKRSRDLLETVKELPIKDWKDYLTNVEYEDVLYLIERYPLEYSALALQLELLRKETEKSIEVEEPLKRVQRWPRSDRLTAWDRKYKKV